MKALVVSYSEKQQDIQLVEKDTPKLKPGECLVKMHAAGLNRRDYWISIGKYPGIKDGVTLGSDGCGEVVEGEDEWIGKQVVINPNVNWGANPSHQSDHYSILGNPHDGTLAEYVAVSTDRLVEKPSYLSSEEAAAFPLAGLTAYRAAFNKAGVKEGDRVLVTGFGGGVSQFVSSFCVAVGARVYVTSSSQKKVKKAIKEGAKGGFDYTESGWAKHAKASVGLFDVVIDSAGGNALNDYLRLIKPAGKIVVYGSTTGKGEGLDVHRLFWSQASIIGSTMGSDEEFLEMIAFAKKHEIRPIINKVYAFSDGAKAIHSLSDKRHFGKSVIKI